MIINRTQAEDARALLELWNIDQPQVALGAMTAEIVSEQYRRAARRCHPDVGGTAAEFAAVDRAKHVLLHWLKREADPVTSSITEGLCNVCQGTGFIRQHRGFAGSLRRQCQRCKGTGDLNYDHDNAKE